MSDRAFVMWMVLAMLGISAFYIWFIMAVLH